MPTDSFTRAEIEQIVIWERLHLYNRGLPCGAQALRNTLCQKGIRPVPSWSTIKCILARHGLTHGRTGHYPQPRQLLYPDEIINKLKYLLQIIPAPTIPSGQNNTLYLS